MKTDSLEVGKVLQDNRRLTVPIYQRQYAWRQERLQPFWEDVVAKADESLEGPPKFQHYMGALILAPGADGYRVGTVSSVQVVDGQQRLTSFYLFLVALRAIALKHDALTLGSGLDLYLYNDQRNYSTGSKTVDRVKLVPTPSDRPLFNAIVANDPTLLVHTFPDYYFQNGNLKVSYAPPALQAFHYFFSQIENYALKGLQDGATDLEGIEGEEDDQASVVAERLQALADAVLIHFKLVTINLDENDDAQVIFETLNSRGEPLLAMDLVRNNIFHRAQNQGESVEAFFEEKWKPFDASFWKDPSPRAKPKRPRIDHFLSHALTAQTGSEISLRELYAEYRAFALPRASHRFSTIAEELDALLQFKLAYETLENRSGDEDIAWLGKKLDVWEVATVYPVVFIISVADVDRIVKRTLYQLLYAYIVRRAVCNLTPKNLNKNFVRIVNAFLTRGVSVESFRSSFSEQTGPAVRFPDDVEFTRAFCNQPIYAQMPRTERIVDMLWELESASRTKFQANESRPLRLSIEHVVPQSWERVWPLPDGRMLPLTYVPTDEDMRSAVEKRRTLLHTFGNLTLVTSELNSSLQNQVFEKKRERLSQSLLSLNTVLTNKTSWDERAIEARALALAGLAVEIWPGLTRIS